MSVVCSVTRWPADLRRAVAAAVMAILAPAAAFGQTGVEHLASGDREHAAMRPAQALVHYEAAAKQDTTLAPALYGVSRAAIDLAEQEPDAARRKALFQKGEVFARRAVAADAHSAEYQFGLARALGRTALSVGIRDRVKYGTDVRARALESLRLDPQHPGALHVLGMWNYEIMSLSGVERFVARKFLGGKVFEQASWDDAQSYMERAVQTDPGRLSHSLDLGRVYLKRGAKDRARERLTFVVEGRQTDYNDPLYKREAASLLGGIK